MFTLLRITTFLSQTVYATDAVSEMNATRFLSMRSGFKGYDYGEIMKMREEIHNAIYDDLIEQKLFTADWV